MDKKPPLSTSNLLNQPKSSSAYWLGRWQQWQKRRHQAKAKLDLDKPKS